ICKIIRKIPPYMAIIERAAHRHDDSLSTTDVGAHWYDHFKSDVSAHEKVLKDQAVCFFRLVSGASLGTIIMGRRGTATRISFASDAISKFVAGDTMAMKEEETQEGELPPGDEAQDQEGQGTKPLSQITEKTLGQGIFIAHGKNKKPLEQLKKILGQFKIPYKVAIEEPSLGRPISGKVREIMNSCNCAILIFTAEEEFQDKEGNTIWKPSENVVHELGAAAFLYDNRIVIMKEEGVDFPSNFKDIGYISFEKDQLDAKTMDILKELIGFGIVKIST
ncbi:nucleotide-binding protein, partial [bacterium]|nr:nucleotide-binding protein [bacterium]